MLHLAGAAVVENYLSRDITGYKSNQNFPLLTTLSNIRSGTGDS